MFQELKSAVRDAQVPDTVKLALSVLIKAVTWFPWVFIGIGILLNREYFIYWLGFFLFVEGLLILSLVYVLVIVVRSTVSVPMSPAAQAPASTDEKLKDKFGDTVLKGVIGNAAFYLFILAALIIVKGMGVFDELWQAILKRIAGG